MEVQSLSCCHGQTASSLQLLRLPGPAAVMVEWGGMASASEDPQGMLCSTQSVPGVHPRVVIVTMVENKNFLVRNQDWDKGVWVGHPVEACGSSTKS